MPAGARHLRRSVSALAAAAISSGALAASCGSRTGLFGPDGLRGAPDGSSTAADASINVESDGAVPCLPGRFDLDLATAQLMFVIDRSGSMAESLDGEDPPPPGQESRWRVLRDALAATILPFDQELAMGAKFYPEVGADGVDPDLSCRTDTGVGLAPARGNVNSILSVFDTTEPRGGTPTAEALRLAAQFLAQRRTVARTMVLATDGAPNCNANLDAFRCTCTSPRVKCTVDPDVGRYICLDDDRTISTIRQIADVQKIPVYVIGIGSTERPEFLRVLDDMAVAGGRPRPTSPRHYNVQTALEMKTALTTIRDSVAKCTYLTPSSPNDPDAISVEIDGKTVPRDQTRNDGWDWVDQSFGEIAFFGAACEQARAGTAKVTGVVSCEKR